MILVPGGETPPGLEAMVGRSALRMGIHVHARQPSSHLAFIAIRGDDVFRVDVPLERLDAPDTAFSRAESVLRPNSAKAAL